MCVCVFVFAVSDLRLVVLGRTGAGKRSAVCSILGLQDCEQGKDPGCSKHRGEVAGRQVRRTHLGNVMGLLPK